MTRQEKYRETETFHYHNQNPKNRITGDCAFRAISLATGKPYNECVMEMAEMMCKTGYAINDSKGIDRYLTKLGWKKMPQPRKSDGKKYTGKEFCEQLSKGQIKIHGDNTKIIANIGGHHIVCINYYQAWDIWNSTNGCIGNYWIKG